ncbi:DUF3292 domain-containing protein [Stenotrophomonas sp. GD03777]|uniref:DUF7657 domain-containing protein n=1 Tax=Stenotrophomonas TaxID=40323 RepID=UPI00244BE066|nr:MULTISPECIES: hypothetical protein [Stenotrophomonas]MDH1660430.1 DUF3292 domain-containing protein [Stenotrophomonas sp. GD03777]
MMTDSGRLPFPRQDAGLLGGLSPNQARLFLGLIAAFCIVYVALALTPSSYSLAFERLGLEPLQPLLGTARSIRSDEWMVYTPYVQIAVANDFGQVNAHSPYHESLRTFQALPLLDWGLLFKPYHWAFFVLPPANAYSFFFAFMAVAFLSGWTTFLRQLQLPLLPALLIASTLFFSPFVQVWWSSNAGAFALAPWVAVAWLGIGNRWLRIMAGAYALSAWLVAATYPPFTIGSLLTMGLLVLAFRRETLSFPRLLDAVAAGLLSLAVFFGYFHEIIQVARDTVYPGQRASAGGGVSLITLLAHLFPNLMTYKFAPLPSFRTSNECEIAVLGSLLPLFTLVLADGVRFRSWARSNRRALWILAAGLLMVACWMFLPVPVLIGKLTGLSLVPPIRALLAFGLLLNIGCAIILVRCGVLIQPRRVLLLAGLLALGSAAKYLFGDDGFHQLYSSYDTVPYLCLAALAIVASRPRCSKHAPTLVLATAALANLLGNGLFNPVQPAGPIFSIDRQAVLQAQQARGARSNADGALVATGSFGGLLPGAGIPAVNHVLYLPQMKYFRRYFPTMPDSDFNFTFNRYHHVSVNPNSEAPRLIQADLVEVPAKAMLASPAKP